MNFGKVNVSLLGRFFLCRLRRTIITTGSMGSNVEQSELTTPSVPTRNEYIPFQHKVLTADNVTEMARMGAGQMMFGHVIAIPTDTVYGLAADSCSDQGIALLYKIKGRDPKKPIAISVTIVDQVKDYAKVTVPRELLRDIFPGPVTLVFERLPNGFLNPAINPGNPFIGIRIPHSEFVRKLAAENSGAIALTSANPSSGPSSLHPEEFNSLWPELRIVFDGGRIGSSTGESESPTARAGSTVINLAEKGYYKIIRRGAGYEAAIAILKKYNLEEILTVY